MKKIVYIIVLLISFVGISQENPIKVSADTTFIRIGEQFVYKITVEGSKKEVIFPKLDSLQNLEVVKSFPIDSLKNKLEKKYLLTSFDSGQYAIPQQKIRINHKKYLTDSLLINVATVKVDTTKQKMYPIKAIKSEPKTIEDYVYQLWWIPIILLIALAVALYFILRKKKSKILFKKQIPPMQEAIQRLQKLDKTDYLKENELKKYYTELTDIIRTYIEKDIHIPALESTTNELMETITDINKSSNLQISKETLQQLKSILQSADLVKFAKSKPLISDAEKDRVVTEKILQNIEPKKVEENESVE